MLRKRMEQSQARKRQSDYENTNITSPKIEYISAINFQVIFLWEELRKVMVSYSSAGQIDRNCSDAQGTVVV